MRVVMYIVDDTRVHSMDYAVVSAYYYNIMLRQNAQPLPYLYLRYLFSNLCTSYYVVMSSLYHVIIFE